MPTSDLPRIDLVVLEVLCIQGAILVSDETISLHVGGVELDLQLDVVGHGAHGGAEVLPEHALRLLDRVNIGVVAVSIIGDGLHLRVLVVALPKAKHR